MIYKNAEIHNAAEIEMSEKDGSMIWYRMPKYLTDKFEISNAKNMNIGSTGVEIRFVIKSGTAEIRMRAENSKNNCFHIFRGGVQGGYLDNDLNIHVGSEETVFTIGKAENIETLKKMSGEAGDGFSPEVIRLIFDRGRYRIIDITGDIEPPKTGQKPEKTLLCYGSSITHGSISLDASHSWASVLAYNLHMDLRNLGMAGSCAIEPEVIDYIASEGEKGKWDMLILELGANVLSWDERKIRERTEYAISKTAERNQDKKIYVISPLYCSNDFHGGKEAAGWRKILKETIGRLEFKNVTYIDGTKLLNKMSLLTADEVHPNIFGVQQIAERLTNIIL